MAFLENYYNEKELKKYRKIITKIRSTRAKYAENAELDLVKEMLDVRNSTSLKNDEKIIRAMALADIAAEKTVHKTYYDVQFMGGLALSQGKIAQMKTGEGKTLMCSLGVAANFVLGFKVHVSTANEYLAKRDQETLVDLYNALGIKSSYNISTSSQSEKRKAYEADVMYSTATEKGFDYLRDNTVDKIEKKIQPLDFLRVAAIIDEADFILIDEARTPLILSANSEVGSENIYHLMREIALTLKQMEREPEKDLTGEYEQIPGDYWIDHKTRSAHLSEEGYDSLERLFKEKGILEKEDNLYLRTNAWMIDAVVSAIKAEKIYIKDKQYVVYKGEIIIIDENTGRLSDGRRWSDGLHQAIEAKEGVEIKPENVTSRSISIQNFYRHYGKISGMTGTAQACSDEFLEVYGTQVVVIPTNKEIQRIDFPDAIFFKAEAKYQAIIEDIVESHQKGQPILVATTSVLESEHISNLLRQKNIFHYVLNAKNHALEAQIVAMAGIAGSVTVATSMAGRGTDIILGGNKEELILMREKQLNRCTSLRNIIISRLATLKAIQAGEKIQTPNLQWNDLVKLEEYLNAITKKIQEEPTEDIQINKTILGQILSLEIFLNQEIQKIKENWENERNKAIEAGGLYVLGCSRNESRRIDDQIKGRSGRQGDVGKSRFYISFEDTWLAGYSQHRMMKRVMAMDPDSRMDSAFLSRSVNSMQKTIENNHYEMRKNTVKFDSVLNEARIEFFQIRDQMISGSDLMKNILIKEIEEDIEKLSDFDYTEVTSVKYNNEQRTISSLLEEFLDEKTSKDNKEKLIVTILQKTLTIDLDFIPELFENLYANGLEEKIENSSFKDEEQLVSFLQEAFKKHWEDTPDETWKFYLSQCLTSMDKAWMTFIEVTDEIRNSSQLSSFAQKNPVYVYKSACYDIFEDLIQEFKDNLINIFLDSQIELREFKERQATEAIMRERHLKEVAEREKIMEEFRKTFLDPETFIVDIDPSLIFHGLNNDENELELLDPEELKMDIDPAKIFIES